MSRREIVVLVSRALAFIQLSWAIVDATYLPRYFMEMMHYAGEIGHVRDSNFAAYLFSMERFTTIMAIVRVAILLIFAIVLWHCGPWVERKLLPRQDAAQESAEASA